MLKLQKIAKPAADEYAAYAGIYVELTPDDGMVLDDLAESAANVEKLFRAQPEERLLHRYAPGKWTMKEVLAHLTDDDRIYAYRALRFARNDATELPGYDQELFAANSNANTRPLDDLLGEYARTRRSTIDLFNSFTDEALLRRGKADGSSVTVRGLAYHLLGHEMRHVNILRERYGAK
jgi:hypothetical protein